MRTLAEWRRWLVRHHDSETEVWLIFHERHTGRQCIAYTDALDEALCFGWIDSAKRQETKDRRLEEAISLLSAGRKLGLK